MPNKAVKIRNELFAYGSVKEIESTEKGKSADD